MTPNQALGDVMTDDTYRDDDEKKEKKEKKDDKKDDKKKSVAFKVTSSKGKAKQDTSSEDKGSFSWDDDDEKVTLFVKRFGKFMVKKGYRARRKKSSSKNKEGSRRCFKHGSKDHLIAQYPRRRTKKRKEREERQDDLQEEEGWFICGHLG
jgi:hypothetical protein